MVGDWDDNTYSSDNNTFNQSITVTQSPDNITTYNKKLVKSAGYFTIFHTDTAKYELSAQMKVLRKTITQNKREILYSRVDDIKQRHQIESRSPNWIIGGIKSQYDYYILRQGDSNNKSTGYIKVVEKSKATVNGIFDKNIKAKDEDWIYYARR